MSELTTVARPYAKAAFDYAVEQGSVDQWFEMLVFAAEVANNETMASHLSGGFCCSHCPLSETIKRVLLDTLWLLAHYPSGSSSHPNRSPSKM